MLGLLVLLSLLEYPDDVCEGGELKFKGALGY